MIAADETVEVDLEQWRAGVSFLIQSKVIKLTYDVQQYPLSLIIALEKGINLVVKSRTGTRIKRNQVDASFVPHLDNNFVLNTPLTDLIVDSGSLNGKDIITFIFKTETNTIHLITADCEEAYFEWCE